MPDGAAAVVVAVAPAMNDDEIPSIQSGPLPEEGELLDGGLIEEKPEKPEHLQAQIEGKQLAWLYLPGFTPAWRQMVDIGSPDRWEAIALEFTDGSKMQIFAAPVEPPGSYHDFRTVLLWRWFEKATWATPKQLAHWRGKNSEPIISPIQIELHGCLVRGVTVEPQPNAQAGQNALFEFSEGKALHVRTRRRAQKFDPHTGECAAFEIGLRKPNRVITDLGTQLPGGGIITP